MTTKSRPRPRPVGLPAATLWRAVPVFVPLALLAAGALYYVHQRNVAEDLADLRHGEKNVVELAAYRLSANLLTIVADIRFLAAAKTLHRWLASADAASRRDLEQDLLSLVRVRRTYDQVRFIDADGQEIARANWNVGRPAIVPRAALQNKADRYYVREVAKLGPGRIYVSPFDLNVEHGVVERPEKPTLRLAIPVFDSAGRRRGAMVINLIGLRLIDALRALRSASRGEIWLLNADGYWLVGPAADEWAFMYPDRKDRTVARAHPAAWRRMLRQPASGQFVSDGDLFTYVRADVPLGPPALTGVPATPPGQGLPHWFVVSRVPAATLAEIRTGTGGNAVGVAALVLGLLVVGSLGTGYHRAHRERAESTLRASERRFRSLMEAAPDAVVVSDADGRIVFVNDKVEQVFGHRGEDLVGKKVEVLAPERFAEDHVAHRAGYMARPTVGLMATGVVPRGLRSDGTEIPIEVSLGFTDVESDTLVMAIIRDLSELRARDREIVELNARLSRDNAELQAVNKELEAFSYSVSHDLRAPLRAIDGFSTILVEEYAALLGEAGRDYAMRIRRAAQRMGMLIDDLLNLSRITRREVARQDVDLSAIGNELAKLLAARDTSRDVAFEVAEGLSARADPGLTRVVLENLMSNALKFTKDRHPARIELGRAEVDGAPAFYVRDNGVGFDMAYAGKLFGAFQRLHDAEAFPGTGIGLATVHRIATKHGGRVWAEAEPGRGATFYFTL